MSIPVTKTERFGLPVYLSENAEEGRKTGCLCVHKENGQYVYCRRLLNNLALQKHLAATLGEAKAKKELRKYAREYLKRLFTGGIFDKDKIFSPDPNDVCPIAVINYEICRAANMAFATAWCPGYVPPEGQTVSEETK